MKLAVLGSLVLAVALPAACAEVDRSVGYMKATGDAGQGEQMSAAGRKSVTQGGSAATTAGKSGQGLPAGGAPDAGGAAAEASVGGTASTLGGSESGGTMSSGAGTSSGGADTRLGTLQSSGCGLPLPPNQVATVPGSRTGYTEWHVQQTGASLGTDVPSNAGDRQFFVRVPVHYDPSKAYRVVYIGSGCGAQHAGKTNTFPLFNEAQGGDEDAIYVGLSIPDNAANPGCYDNNSGVQSQEWEAFDLIHSVVESTYCVDNNRIYVAGYSTGAWVANMWGCYFSGTPGAAPLDQPDVDAGRTHRKFGSKWSVRGRVATAGSLPPNQPTPCNGPSAGLWIHDQLDKSNLIETNIAALNLALKTNGCTGNYADGPKRPWAPAETITGLQGGICQEYTGCPAEVAAKYPLVFCTTSGFGHADQSLQTIPAATKFFAQTEQ